MKIDVLTLFPEMFKGPFDESILKRAQEDKKIEIKVHNLRDWAEDKHNTTDLPPYGGGPGMVMKVDVIDRAVESLRTKSSVVVLLDTKGKVFSQAKAEELSGNDHLILIAGHYEGVDHRVHDYIADEVISIGKYVLTGGEIPAMVVVDSVVRLIPGILGNSASLDEESYGKRGKIEHPQYTRPEEYKDWKVPKVLLSGDHKKIEEWRKT
jgi:tRNA (guanine37-N1)-methyltransferase